MSGAETSRAEIAATGGCLCGAVRYEVRGSLTPVSCCHCSQCRRATGHFLASTSTPRKSLRLIRETGLRWYQSSKRARRGFCGVCGSTLFWDGQDFDIISIAAGTLDSPTGLAIGRHIFTANKGDYYEIDDGAAQYPQWPDMPG